MDWDGFQKYQCYACLIICECGEVFTIHTRAVRQQIQCYKCLAHLVADNYTIFDIKKDREFMT